MILDIFNSSFERIQNVDKYSFAQYTDPLNDSGKFKLQVSVDTFLERFLDSKYILFDDGILGIIKTISDDDGITIVITGQLIRCLLSHRCFINTQNFNADVSQVLRQFVTSNFISPIDAERRMPIVTLASDAKYAPTIGALSTQETDGSIERAMQAICDTHQIGYDLYPIIADASDTSMANIKNLEFRVIKGADRSIGNTAGNDPVEFSADLKNILDKSYKYDESAYSNTAYVAGEGDGADRVVVKVEPTAVAGIDRIELYVDARDLQQKDSTGTVMTPEAYAKTLSDRGTSKLQENRISQSFSVTIDNMNPQFVYGKDYFKGDKVSLEDKRLGVRVNLIVTGVTITSIGSRSILDLTFGYENLTTIEKLKRKGTI